jgi:hypothetical protein
MLGVSYQAKMAHDPTTAGLTCFGGKKGVGKEQKDAFAGTFFAYFPRFF